MMNIKLVNTLEEILATNLEGNARNIFITDNNEEFLEDALNSLKEWGKEKSFNLVVVDEKDVNLISEINNGVILQKLNRPNTILLIKNYAMVNNRRKDNKTSHEFLREVVINRSCWCNDEAGASIKLENLLFIVIINDVSEMYWKPEEYLLFTIIHENNRKGAWINKKERRIFSKMYPVMSYTNKIKYFISEDESTICIDADDGLMGTWNRKFRFRKYFCNEYTKIFYMYLKDELFCSYKKVECLILKADGFNNNDHFVLDSKKLKKIFPNLSCVCCVDAYEIINDEKNIQVLYPFELGELAFNTAQTGDFETANKITRKLWALDRKCAKFYRDVAVDFMCPHKDHPKCYSDGNVAWTGIDNLFRIYLLGWYSKNNSFEEECLVHLTKYQSFEKAVDVLESRFKNWDNQEIGEKIYWDLEHIKRDKNFDENIFDKVLEKVKQLYPEVKIFQKK